MSQCKVQDDGAGSVTHFGAHAGGGVFFHRDEDTKQVTICHHPHGDARIPATFAVTVEEKDFVKALKNAGDVPETRDEREAREAAEREADAKAKAKAEAKAAKAGEGAAE